jgi:type I site-specific restriction endonuclease
VAYPHQRIPWDQRRPTGRRTQQDHRVVDVATLQTLARAEDVADLAAGYGLVVVDECHHVPAAAFTSAVTQIPARRWLGLTATPTDVTSSTTSSACNWARSATSSSLHQRAR